MQLFLDLLVIGGSYLVGSLSTGHTIVKIKTGKDIRKSNSGSSGGRNVGRSLGAQGFIITLIGDMLKGVAVAGVCIYTNRAELIIMSAMLALIIGHNWPFYLGFRGGRGLSPALGFTLVFDYQLILLIFLLMLILILITRKFTIGGLIGVGLSPLIVFGLDYSILITSGFILVAGIILFAHRPANNKNYGESIKST